MKPTRDEILAEPAGPRMDAWVAEFVMEWELIDNPVPSWFAEAGWESLDRDIYCVHDSTFTQGKEIIHANKNGYSRFKPSVYIAAAWIVLMKLLQMQISSEIISHFCSTGGDFVCHVWRYDSLSEGSTARANTAPLAICRAALIAKVV